MQTVMTKQEGVDVSTPVTSYAVKQIVRWISKMNVTNPAGGYDAVTDVDAELEMYYGLGYKLFATHFLGENPEGFGMLYVLVRS